MSERGVDRVIALGLLAVTTTVWIVFLQFGIYSGHGISDLPVYEAAYRQMQAGELPYRDFDLEYPPIAAALFWLAGVLPGRYGPAFSGLMLVCLLATLLGTLATARALGASRRRTVAAGLVVALLPLLVGNMVETRFDLLFAAILSWTAWALVSRRFGMAWALIGLGVMTKLVPLAFVPLVVVAHWRDAGPARTARSLGLTALGLGATIAPVAIAAPGGAWHILGYHIDRPLQIESTGASYLEVLAALVGRTLRVSSSFGSQGLPGSGPSAVAAISTALLALAVVGIAVTAWVLLGRVRVEAGGPIVLAALAATVASLLAFGKVMSPQFVVWLAPVAFLIGGRYGRAAFAAGLAAMLLTLAYFPHHYWDLVALDAGQVTIVALRNAVLIGLVAASWPRPAPSPRKGMLAPARVGKIADDAADQAVAARYLID